VGYTFQASTYQVGVLLLFDALPLDAWLSAEDIQTATLLNDTAMRGTLLSLVKTTVLTMTPKPVGGVIRKDHRFQLNKAFKSKKTRVLINVPVQQVRKQETEQTHKTIVADRKLLVEVCACLFFVVVVVVVVVVRTNNNTNNDKF
jgi:cullin 1